MSFFPELDDLNLHEMRQAFADPRDARAHGEEADLWLQELAAAIAQSLEGIDFLLASLPTADESRLHAILVGLSAIGSKLPTRKRNQIWRVGREFLGAENPTLVSAAVDLLNRLGCKDARDEVLKHRNDESPFVVGSVLRYMSRHFPQKAVPMLQQALASRNPIVRQNGIDELDELNCIQALPTIKRLVKDKDRHVRQAARTAVRNLEETERTSRR